MMNTANETGGAQSPAQDHPPFKFTIFIPTFNRAHTLPRAFESIQQQTFRDFEVLIIDDGSTDGTERLVRSWAERCAFPVTYRWQENRGKHGAHNAALPLLRGEMTVILDSDDVLMPEALELLNEQWQRIPADQRPGFSGVEGHVEYFDGTLEGSRFPVDVLDTDYLTMRQTYAVRGDKRGCVRTDILRAFPYPEFPGERHVRPSLLWKRIAHKYRTRYINRVIMRVERQPGGLSSDRFALRMRNPMGFRLYFLEEVNINTRNQPLRIRYNCCANYVRYSLHGDVSAHRQREDIRAKALWLAALPAGFLRYCGDRIRQQRRRPR